MAGKKGTRGKVNLLVTNSNDVVTTEIMDNVDVIEVSYLTTTLNGFTVNYFKPAHKNILLSVFRGEENVINTINYYDFRDILEHLKTL